MPELPEVEHARRQLAQRVGARIERVTAHDTIVLGGQPKRAFEQRLRGKRIEHVERRGKSLLVHLSDGAGLALHLGMSGALVLARPGASAPRFARVTFDLGEDGLVFYDDARKLGRLHAGTLEEARRAAKYDRLGPDARTVETAEALAARFENARAPIKAALLDQKRLAGIGNIHASEALFLARIDPHRAAGALTTREWKRLYAGMHETIDRALDELDRLDAQGEPLVYVSAGGDNPFLVYGREGAPCPRCGRPIVRETQAGRSTFFCTHCQKT